MQPLVRSPTFVLIILCCAYALVGCAATMPSMSSGTSKPSFSAQDEMPRRIMIRSNGISRYDPVGDVLRSELPTLGFTVDYTDPDAVFDATVKYSDYSPVHLDITLSDLKTKRIIWSASIVKKWDFYASVVSASESNAKKAMALFRRDLARNRPPK